MHQDDAVRRVRVMCGWVLALALLTWLAVSWWRGLNASPVPSRHFARVVLLPDAPPAMPAPQLAPRSAPHHEPPPPGAPAAAPPTPTAPTAPTPSPHDVAPDTPAGGPPAGLDASDGTGDGPLGIGALRGTGSSGGDGAGAGEGGLGQRLYHLHLQRRLQERLAQEPRLQTSHYACQMVVWMRPDGSLGRIQPDHEPNVPPEAAAICDSLPALMTQLGRVADPPPAGLRQPIVLRVANRFTTRPSPSDPLPSPGLAARP